MGQKVTIFQNRNNNGQSKGIFIAKSSIGIININGVKYSYNIDKVENNVIDFNNKINDAINGIDTQAAKKQIYIRKR